MASQNQPQVQVAVIESAEDLKIGFDVVYQCFGIQVPDQILQAQNPGWDTPEGRVRATERMTTSFESSTSRDKHGRPNKIFLKATLPDPESGTERIVGLAVWLQLSVVEGHGEPPVEDLSRVMDLEALYPGDTSEQNYLCELDRNLHRQRTELAKSKANASPPAVMALDLCVVHPSFQRRGIATKLVQWGLDEAKRRGGLEACMEASTMGRHVYGKMGFQQEGPEIDYGVEGAKFAQSGMPSNIFMRTGAN
ncbi:hypothetical protein LTS08_004197 [Lithohypha guttulata]|uniref:uncharacterized protein n=1 Tax=Lithohypha guttulata TaxID=1690604 RepID=UPI002DDE38E7|nr:hypothetical protein LTR51_005755 [Lithohypha guttulata]KAK5101738.1 hypothetical protein LTS08_004197 [Lithohypha guttulata]